MDATKFIPKVQGNRLGKNNHPNNKKPSMATNSNSGPPAASKNGEDRILPPPSQPLEMAVVKQEPQELDSIEPIKNSEKHDGRSEVAATLSSAIPEEQCDRESSLIKSVNELCSFSTVLHAFKRRWDELQNHLDFIQNAIDTCSKEMDFSPQQVLNIVPTTQTPTSNTEKLSVPDLANNQSQNIEQKSFSNDATKQSSRSELENLCLTMGSRDLRKYIVSRLSDVAKLREEVTAALKIAPNPSKLVLECIGRFFLQGRKAFSKDSPMIPAREASVRILEFYLLTGCTEIEPSVKEEAELAAVAWRKRLIAEGGVSRANDIDSRGLLLLVGSFGIPKVFKNEELGDLIRSSKAREISDALRRSNILLKRIPDIIEWILKIGKKAEAADIALTFGVEDKFHPRDILTSFLRESKDTWKRRRREAQGSLTGLREANERQLAALKSVLKCSEDHKIDPFPGWQIKDKIISLEKDIADIEKKMEEKAMSKRKVDELESSILLKSQEIKRSRFAANVSPMKLTHGLHEQRAAAQVDGRISFDRLTAMSLFDGSLVGHDISHCAASSVSHGSSAASLPDHILGTMTTGGGGMLAARVGSGMSTGHSGFLSTNSFPGVHRDILADQIGPMSKNNGTSYGWPGLGDGAFSDRFIRQRSHGFAGHPASVGNSSLFGPSPSLEGFAGLPKSPSIGVVANRSSTSDLYQFADAVLEGESYYSRLGR